MKINLGEGTGATTCTLCGGRNLSVKRGSIRIAERKAKTMEFRRGVGYVDYLDTIHPNRGYDKLKGAEGNEFHFKPAVKASKTDYTYTYCKNCGHDSQPEHAIKSEPSFYRKDEELV